MPTISDLLAFSQPVAVDDPQALARKQLNAANKLILDTAMTMPDDEELQEGQKIWIEKWDSALKHSHSCLLKAKECGIEACLEGRVREKMKEVAPTVDRWRVRMAERHRLRDKCEREEREQTEPVRKEQGPRSKRVRLVVEDEDDDEGEEDTRPAKTTGPPTVTHEVPCAACARSKIKCRGPEDRRCARCTQLRAKCEKSVGRGKCQKKAERVHPVVDRKGKAPVSTAGTRRQLSPAGEPIVLDTSDEGKEEDGAPKDLPTVKVLPNPPIAKLVIKAGVRAVNHLEGKIRHTQARLKAAEAAMADLEADVAGQMSELATIKEALGMR